MSAQSARSIMWLTILLDASVKGVIVLALAGALSVALRRASAASRHLVWSLALASLIGLPVLSALLPSWHVPILPRPVQTPQSYLDQGRSGVPPDNTEVPERAGTPGETPALPVGMGYSDAAPGAMMSETATPSLAGVEPMTRSRARLPWPVWIFLAWVIGGVGAIVPLLIGIVAVLGRTRRATQVTEGVCAKLLPVLSEQLDVHRRVRLLESDDASVPTTWGVLRPVVLLPSEARNWPEERCWMVLLHELSHIRRGDWLTQTLGRAACALHWFNPLVWLAARRLRLESEQACDDALLRAGYKASGYAHQLMELVRTLRPARCASLATVPMARSSRIEKRLTAILDATRNRRALTHLSIALALIVVSCTVMPLAALRPTARNAQAEEASLSPKPAPVAEREKMLKQIGFSLKMYAGESQGGRFPPKASGPSGFHPEMEGLVHFLDEGGADASELVAYLKGQRGIKVCYLGYVVTDEKLGLALLEELSGYTDKELPHDVHVSRAEAGYDTIYMLREGIERFLITDINDPAAAAATQSIIPVVWEIPDPRDGDGGWVLYMDGHVEWKAYPGEFPMTEAFITRLREVMASPAAAEDAPQPRAAARRVGMSARRRPTSETSDLPQLRYLAWQTEKGQEEPVKYWRPDGREVVDEDQITMVETWLDVTRQEDASHPDYRHMHFWFAHPETDRLSYFEATLLDSKGRPFEDLGSAGSTHPAGELTGNVGWYVLTRSLGAADEWPESVRIRVHYAVGPWEYRHPVPADFNGSMALDNHATLGSIGQNTEGRTFISSIQDKNARTVQFDFVAVTKDGREVERAGWQRVGHAQRLQETYMFDEPLANVKEFKLRVRPIRTVMFEDVSLVPGKLTDPEVAAIPRSSRPRGPVRATRPPVVMTRSSSAVPSAAPARTSTTTTDTVTTTARPRTATGVETLETTKDTVTSTARRRTATGVETLETTKDTVTTTARRPVARTSTTAARAPAEPDKESRTEARYLPGARREGTKPASLTMRVVDAGGRPVEGARVVLYHNKSRWGLGNRVVEEALSGADGTVSFKMPLVYETSIPHSYASDSYIVLAVHRHYALAWAEIEHGKGLPTRDLVMTPPKTWTITVTDHDGNPLQGARVWLYHAGDRESSDPRFRHYLSLPTDVGLIGATTNADGKAVVTNLPDTDCAFHASLPGYADGLAFPGAKEIRLSKGATVAGRLITEDDQPVAGAIVRFHTDCMWQFFLAETDKEGRYRLEDLPAKGWDMSPWGEDFGASGLYSITIENEDYAAPKGGLELHPGRVIDDLDIIAYPGTLVTCRVVESGTGRPVAGARISGDNESGRIDGFSNAEGVLRIRVMPGSTSLFFSSPPDGVYVVEDRENPIEDSHLQFDTEGDEMEVTLRTPPIAGRLTPVRGSVAGPDGAVPSGVIVYASAGRFDSATKSGYVPSVGVEPDGAFTLEEVPAGLKLHIYAETADRKLGATAVFHIPADLDEVPAIRIKIEPTKKASAVVKDEAGQPIGKADVAIRPVVDGEVIVFYDREAQLDDESRLEVDGIVPGLEYQLRPRREEAGTGLTTRQLPYEVRMRLIEE